MHTQGTEVLLAPVYMTSHCVRSASYCDMRRGTYCGPTGTQEPWLSPAHRRSRYGTSQCRGTWAPAPRGAPPSRSSARTASSPPRSRPRLRRPARRTKPVNEEAGAARSATHQGREEHDDGPVERRDDEHDALGLGPDLGAHGPPAEAELGLLHRGPLLAVVVCALDVDVGPWEVDAAAPRMSASPASTLRARQGRR